MAASRSSQVDPVSNLDLSAGIGAPSRPGASTGPGPSSPPTSGPAGLIAPLWHTITLGALFVFMAAAGALFQKSVQADPGIVQHSGAIPLYFTTLVAEWGLVFFVWKGGLRRRGLPEDRLLWRLLRSARTLAPQSSPRYPGPRRQRHPGRDLQNLRAGRRLCL
jgi:hypothetical protein